MMTEYERLSLQLLASILSGQILQVSQGSFTTPAGKKGLEDKVTAWAASSMGVIKGVREALHGPDEPDPEPEE
jgi:hypothetical protein